VLIFLQSIAKVGDFFVEEIGRPILRRPVAIFEQARADSASNGIVCS
jgi:hypothetical protein